VTQHVAQSGDVICRNAMTCAASVVCCGVLRFGWPCERLYCGVAPLVTRHDRRPCLGLRCGGLAWRPASGGRGGGAACGAVACTGAGRVWWLAVLAVLCGCGRCAVRLRGASHGIVLCAVCAMGWS